MAGNVDGAGFWLPSEFFDDFVTDKENLDKNHSSESDFEFCFPSEFPYDVQIQSGEHFEEKRRMMSTSPQSTLALMWSFSGPSSGGSSIVSPNGVSSPPTTPLGSESDAVGDLIYRAAGQVAKLKLNGDDVAKHAGLLGPPKGLEQLYPAAHNPNTSAFHNIYLHEQMVKQQKQGYGMWYGEPQLYQMRSGNAVARTGQEGQPIQPNPARIGSSVSRAGSFGGSGGSCLAVKRECAGTGFFLPRRYENINDCNAYFSDSRKRPGNSSTYILDRNVHALNKNMDDKINSFASSQPLFQPNFNRAFGPDYNLLMARRNGLMLRHQRSLLLEGSSPTSRAICLPQEWTY